MAIDRNKVNIFVSDSTKELAAFPSGTLTKLFSDVSLIGKRLNFDILEPNAQRTKFGEYTVRDFGVAPPATVNVKDLSKVNIFVSDATKELAAFSVDELTTLFTNPALFDKRVNFDILQFNGQRIKFGEYTIKGNASHVCADPNAHWDEALQRCVCNTGYEEINGICVKKVEPTPTGLLWSSKIHGKWNDGNKRTITKKQGGQTRDDKSIFVAASGSPKLVIDGDGVAHLVSGSGGVSNISFKGLCSHQGNISPLKDSADGLPCSERGGGEGFSFDHSGWDCKRESCHNNHDSIGSGSIPKDIEDYKWHIAKYSWKHEGSGIRLIGKIDYNDGKGFIKVMDELDSNPNSWFIDPATKGKNTYIWIRLNNADHGRIYIMAANWDAELTVPFMFEPNENSIALKDVELVAI